MTLTSPARGRIVTRRLANGNMKFACLAERGTRLLPYQVSALYEDGPGE